jgi:hypothetical protein
MDYLPTSEADLKAFALNFSALTTANPATYSLVVGDAVAIKTATDNFVASFDLVQNPATQTVPNTIAKNAAKANLVAILRAYAMMIKANRAVSDEEKASLRLAINDSVPTPLPAPEGRPQINVVGVDALRHELRFSDAENPERRSKPAGVLGLQLFRSIGETAPTNPLTCQFQVFVSDTRSTTKLDFDPADAGKIAHYFARWQTRTGLVGPWSLLASRMIAA